MNATMKQAESNNPNDGTEAMIESFNAYPDFQQPWLWPGWLPLGHVTLLAGPPGTGKSMVALDLAARLSRGSAWPDGVRSTRLFDRPQRSLILADEDFGWTVRQRLVAMVADLNQIHLMENIKERGEKFGVDLHEHYDAVSEGLRQYPDLRLMVVDPLASFVGGLNIHSPREGRRMMERLRTLAMTHALSIIAITHLSKSPGRLGLDRAMGSVSLAATARAVYFVMRDPSDDQRRLLIPAKQNLAAETRTLAYRIVPGEGNEPTIVWEPKPVPDRLEEVLHAGRERTYGQCDLACDFLLEVLAQGPRRVTELLDLARSKGFSLKTLRRAKSEVGVRSLRQGFGPQSVFLWRLPEEYTRNTVAQNAGTVPEMVPNNEAKQAPGH